MSQIHVMVDGERHALPTKMEVCPTCRGRGTHVNRNIDGNGLTAEDFAEDPDFEEAYFRGDYDVTCTECGGANVIAVVDEERCSPALLAAYEQEQPDDAEALRSGTGGG